MIAAATRTRVNHLLSAGTTYQGASFEAVGRGLASLGATVSAPEGPSLSAFPGNIQVFRRWRLERDDIAALRIDAGHDVLDRSVLAGRVHGLEDEQDGPAVLRVQHVLEMAQRLDAQREHLLRAWLVLGPEIKRVGGVEVLQPEPVAVRDPERLRECAGLLDGFLDFHGSRPPSHRWSPSAAIPR